MEMGKLIRQARKNAGLMQAELAERVGISINSVRLYESCRLTPKVETLRKVANACGVPLSYFIPAGMDQNGREKTHRRGRKRGRLCPEHQHEPRRQEHDSLAVERGGSFPGLPSGLDAAA